jgi:ATP-binding cassette subfamily C protein
MFKSRDVPQEMLVPTPDGAASWTGKGGIAVRSGEPQGKGRTRRPRDKGKSRLLQKSGQEVLRKALDSCRANFITAGLFSVAINLLMLTVPIYLFQLSDRVLTSRSLETLIMLSIIAISALALLVILDTSRRFILMRVGTELERTLGAPLLASTIHGSNGALRDVQSLRDLQQVRSFASGGVMMTFFDAPMAPLYFVVIFIIHPVLGTIVTVAGLFLLFVAILNQRMTDKHFGAAGGHAIKASTQAAAQARNAQVINAMGMLNESVGLWGADNAASLRAHGLGSDRNLLLGGLSRFVRLLTQIALLGSGAYLALQSELTGGMMIASSIIASRALAPVENAIEGWRSFVQARAAFKRVKVQLNNSERVQERLLLPRPLGHLSVERVLYLAPGSNRPVLNGVGFTLMPGDSLAVIGPSGSGKSTLARLLVGCLTPTAGSIRLDLSDLRNWDPIQLGEHIGYLPQDVELFPATIKANIARLRNDVPDEWITQAAEFAGVHQMISLFPDGYETEIKADGSPLSGGQRQQIALARAFFRLPRVVVLDEPNANLDSAGEQALARALQRAKTEQITVVVVTQRPAILQHVSKILVVRDGKLDSFGDRDEVLQQIQPKTRSKAAAASPSASAIANASMRMPR